MPDNNVCSLVETEDGYLWLSTSSGISHFDPVAETFRHYFYEDGIAVNEFAEQAGLVASDGVIYFFGDSGFVSFRPDRFTRNEYVPPIVIENLYIDNEKIEPGKDKILETNIPWQDGIVLDWD